MTPFLWQELTSRSARNRLWLYGGYPDGGIQTPRSFPRWQLDYLALLTQRDLPAWGLPAKPQVTRRLLSMLAALHGQTWNASQIGQSLGLSYHTVNSYLDYLIGAFLIRLLPPHHTNIQKRIVKSPKLYWRDSGLLHAVLQVTSRNDLLKQPWIDASWEGYVIEQILGTLQQHDRFVEASFLRTSDQQEIDLILKIDRHRWAIEIKLTTTPGPRDMRRLNKTADLIRADRRVLVSQTQDIVENGRQISCNLEWLLEHLE